MRDRVYAPWDDYTVDTLNRFQMSHLWHPFTCPKRDKPGHHPHKDADLGQLIATPDGFKCPDCHYTQNWAHAFMANPDILVVLRGSRR
jgi:hypothetical protein